MTVVKLKRKEGLFDYLSNHLKEKFTAEGEKEPSISWAGVEAAIHWLEGKGIDCGRDLGINFYYIVRERVGFRWTGENLDGEGAKGRWSKRIANYLKYNKNIEIDEAELAEVVGKYKVKYSEGTIFDFSPIDWQAGDFGDTISCFWGGYSSHRKWMISMGFLGCRIWQKQDEAYKGYGRCFLCPTEDGDIALFNGYGMELRDFATMIYNWVGAEKLIPQPRIVEVVLGILSNGRDAGLHPNRECYLITSRTDVWSGQEVFINFGTAPESCDRCGSRYMGGAGWKWDTWALCPRCLSSGINCCSCDEFAGGGSVVHNVGGCNRVLHQKCYDELPTCSDCGDRAMSASKTQDNQIVCRYCARGYRTCLNCDLLIREGRYCRECLKGHAVCECCEYIKDNVKQRADGVMACNGCTWYCEAIRPGTRKAHGVRVSDKTPSDKRGKRSYICPECRELGYDELDYEPGGNR